MNVLEIKNPKFLKNLNEKGLNEVCDDIRAFLIETISKTGGHLSSNLGVVELTTAIHYVFDAPKDKILFDVGHQCYTHKILTGRAPQMYTIRQYNGLSGFQKRYESEYDCFEAGHSSTALSHGFGMAVARDLNHEDYEVVVVVGDGALNSGLSLEALNSIGYTNKKVIIVFNDNNMSISKNVGALTLGFARLRSSAPYTHLKDEVKGILDKSKTGDKTISLIHNVKKIIKNQVIDSGIFKELNIDYLGPIDGHDIKALTDAFETARKCEGPVVVHCVTQKGYGYKYSEEDKSGKWHGVGKFDISSGKMLSSTPEGYLSYSKLVANIVQDKMAYNQDIVTITPAMIGGSALNDIFRAYPERSFDVGITEDHAVAFASGLALNGKRPFAAIYSSFIQRAYDQLNHDIGRMDLPVVFGIDRAGLVGEDGETHHGVFDITFIRPIPNFILAEGKDADEIYNLLDLAFSQAHPFALRFPRGNIKVNDSFRKETIKTGSWVREIYKKDSIGTIITYGSDVTTIASYIEENDMNYSLVNARFIKPMDYDVLREIGEEGKPVYIYTNDMKKGGIGEEICAFFNNNNYGNHVQVFGIDDIFVKHGSLSQLREYLNLDMKSFFKAIGKE